VAGCQDPETGNLEAGAKVVLFGGEGVADVQVRSRYDSKPVDVKSGTEAIVVKDPGALDSVSDKSREVEVNVKLGDGMATCKVQRRNLRPAK
jgi:hypothetical protein